MVLTEQQIRDIKTQLSKQIQHLPPEQREETQRQINQMSPESLEMLMEQQKSAQPLAQSGKKESQKGIFRMIADRDIESAIIGENSSALAVLDINPISKGHAIIIPKKTISDAKNIPTNVFTLAKSLAKKIESVLKAKSSEIQSETKFGEVIINIIPIYDSPLSLNSQRTASSLPQLKEIASKISPVKKKRLQVIKQKKQVSSSIKLKRRVP